MPTHRAKKPYVAPKTDGLFRVRDSLKVGGTVWGENLPHDDAVKLKEQVTGSGKSRTARLEPMEAELQVHEVKEGSVTRQVVGWEQPGLPGRRPLDQPETPRTSAPTQPMYRSGRTINPQEHPGGGVLQPGETTLEQAREAALRAAAPVAAAAQIRARTPSPAPLPPPPVFPVEVEVPDGDNEYLDDGDVADLMSELGGNPSTDDIKRAHAQAEADWKASDAKMRDMESKRVPIPDELVQFVGRVPEGYAKGANGLWSPAAPGPSAA